MYTNQSLAPIHVLCNGSAYDDLSTNDVIGDLPDEVFFYFRSDYSINGEGFRFAFSFSDVDAAGASTYSEI